MDYLSDNETGTFEIAVSNIDTLWPRPSGHATTESLLRYLASSVNITEGAVHSNNSGDHSVFEKKTEIVLTTIYTLTTAFSLFGNTVVIIVFGVGKRSRTDLRGFLINLAVSDLIMAVFCMPFTFSTTMLGYWPFSVTMCPVVLYLQLVAVTSSVCTNMAIGMDRFWVVMFPLKSRLTKSRRKIVICMIWTIALSLSSVQLYIGRAKLIPGTDSLDCREHWPSIQWQRSYSFFILALTYILPLVILSGTYSFVAVRLWQRTTPGNADKARDSHQLRSKRKVIKMLVVIVLLFAICWLPLHTFFLVIDFMPELIEYMNILTPVYLTAHWLAMSNSCVNPIIYGFLNDSFRHDFKRLLRSFCPWCHCLPCLQPRALSRESVFLRGYSRGDNKDSSSGSMRITDHSNKRLLSVRLNGAVKCETKLTPGDALLRKATRTYNGTEANV